MKFIGHYLSEYKLITILAPLFKMLEAIFELLVPLVMARMIDIGIKNRDAGYILHMSFLLVTFAVLGLIVSIVAQYFAALAATRATKKMRSDMFSRMMRFSDATMDKIGASTLITRMTSDLNQVQNGINMFLRLFLRSPFIVIGATVMAYTIDAKAALIFIGVIVILSALVGIIMRYTLPMYRQIQSLLDALFVRVSENLEGVRVIRAFHAGEREREKLRDTTETLYERQMRVGKMQALLNPLTYMTVNLAVVFLLWFTSLRVEVGLLLQGEVVALCNYMSQILVELVKFANLITLVTRGLASAGRIEAVMTMKADERKFRETLPRTKEDMAIEFSDVTFAYGNEEDAAIERISFSVKKGETLGIIGGTGAGKSTIARLMRHAYDATEGRVSIFGKNVQSYADEELNGLIANVPQKASLFSGDIASNLRLGRADATDEELWQALDTAQAKDFIEEKEGGLQAPVQKKGSNFSGGQRQRLTIARALVCKAPILILDDAASALDLATEARLKRALDGLCDVTKVIVSQRASSVRTADKIVVVEDGWCVGIGTHEQLLEGCEIYREIYFAQFPEEAGGAA